VGQFNLFVSLSDEHPLTPRLPLPLRPCSLFLIPGPTDAELYPRLFPSCICSCWRCPAAGNYYWFVRASCWSKDPSGKLSAAHWWCWPKKFPLAVALECLYRGYPYLV